MIVRLHGTPLVVATVVAVGACAHRPDQAQFNAWQAQRRLALQGRAADSVCRSYPLVRVLYSGHVWVHRKPDGQECSPRPRDLMLGPVRIDDHLVCPREGTWADFHATRAGSDPRAIAAIEVVRDTTALANWRCPGVALEPMLWIRTRPPVAKP